MIREHLDSVTANLPPRSAATQISRALRELANLQSGIRPTYDEWVAPLYCLWYQPAHVNLAYTIITRQLPTNQNPLVSNQNSLNVFDFGCGALALQFGLVLAAAEATSLGNSPCQILLDSDDDSYPMKQIGNRIWLEFVNEISKQSKYPRLGALRGVCRSLALQHQRGRRSPSRRKAIRWLSVLHVAYRDNAADVRHSLDAHVTTHHPDLVIVTHNPMSCPFAYSPSSQARYFLSKHGVLDKNNLRFDIRRTFDRISALRSEIYETYREFWTASDRAWDFLVKNETRWTTPATSSYNVWTRDR